MNIAKFNESQNIPIIRKVDVKKSIEDKKMFKDSLLKTSFVSKESKQIKVIDQDLRKSANFSEKNTKIKNNKEELISLGNIRSITPKISNYQGLNIGRLNSPALSPLLPVNNKSIKTNLLLNSNSTQNVKKQSEKK